MGVAKVNLATAAFRAFTQGVQQEVDRTWDPRGYLDPGRESLARWLAELYSLLPGSPAR
ncbi:MAG: class II fructose-bisphosphate aldolase [Thermus sp.]